jgi:hypothetical protein
MGTVCPLSVLDGRGDGLQMLLKLWVAGYFIAYLGHELGPQREFRMMAKQKINTKRISEPTLYIHLSGYIHATLKC